MTLVIVISDPSNSDPSNSYASVAAHVHWYNQGRRRQYNPTRLERTVTNVTTKATIKSLELIKWST